MQAETITIHIERPWRELYDEIWHPSAFPRWASGLADAGLRPDGDRWLAEGPSGPVGIRFSDRNAYGVMDHWVETGTGAVVYVPMRVVANDGGAEIMFTLFRQPEMDDARFAEDLAWVRRDLDALKALAEGNGRPAAFRG